MKGKQRMNWWRKQRERLGISQRAMAFRLGMSNTAVGSWELDRAVPGLDSADALAAAYGVSREEVERQIVESHRRRAGGAAAVATK